MHSNLIKHAGDTVCMYLDITGKNVFVVNRVYLELNWKGDNQS